jgi:hypothetical protein
MNLVQRIRKAIRPYALIAGLGTFGCTDYATVNVNSALNRAPVGNAQVLVTDVDTSKTYSCMTDSQGSCNIMVMMPDPAPDGIDLVVQRSQYGTFTQLNSVFPDSTWSSLKADPNVKLMPYADIEPWDLPNNPLTGQPYGDSIEVFVTATGTYPGVYGNDNLEHWTPPIKWHINREAAPTQDYIDGQLELMQDVNDALRPNIGEDLYTELPGPIPTEPNADWDWYDEVMFPREGIKTIYVSGSSTYLIVAVDENNNPKIGLQRVDNSLINKELVMGESGNETIIGLNGIGEFDPNGMSVGAPYLSNAEKYVLRNMFNLKAGEDMKKYFEP